LFEPAERESFFFQSYTLTFLSSPNFSTRSARSALDLFDQKEKNKIMMIAQIFLSLFLSGYIGLKCDNYIGYKEESNVVLKCDECLPQ